MTDKIEILNVFGAFIDPMKRAACFLLTRWSLRFDRFCKWLVENFTQKFAIVNRTMLAIARKAAQDKICLNFWQHFSLPPDRAFRET